jgi:probable HAF family extracellular repeat protein
MQDLDTLGGFESRANGLNDSGHVVGQSRISTGETHAFLYSDAQMQDLGTLNGASTSSANDINDLGQVVGSGSTSTGAHHAFLY